ncbi:MAG: thiamine phosphate synthase [Pyrinomonadaceae bacterium]
MRLENPRPLLYLITSGTTTSQTTPDADQFDQILKLITSAVTAKVSYVQIREKQLTGRVLFELASHASEITRKSATRVLINDRADIASATGLGVHLASHSLPVQVVRATFGPQILIGASTHSVVQASVARTSGANFVVYGPVFETESKKIFGPPQGIEELRLVVNEMDDFPVVAIGGISRSNVGECFRAGAAGVAAITMFGGAEHLQDVVSQVREQYKAENENN